MVCSEWLYHKVASCAGISPETLRKIESGRLPTPAFGTVVGLAYALDIPLQELADAWLSASLAGSSTA